MEVRRRALRAALAAIAALAACGGATIAFAATSFSDPAGDNNAAPDVTSVTVAEATATSLTITVRVANHQSLPRDSWLNVWFDLDLNPNTGDEGDEALIQFFDDGGLRYFHWNGSELARRPTLDMSGTFAAGLFTLTLPTSTFESASTFGVLVVGARAQDIGGDEDLVATDFAPDGGAARGRYVAPGPSSFTDASGDHDAAPDVTRVQVADTKAGTIAFTIATPSHARLSPDNWVELDVDVDRRRSTGNGGVDVYVQLFRGRAFAGRWNATSEEFDTVRNAGVRGRSSNGVVTLEVPRRLLDDAARFDFYVLSGDSDVDEEQDFAMDIAPDGDAWWRYALANRPALRLIAGGATGLPARPRAGAAFTVVVPIRRSDTGRGLTAGSVACRVTVQGQRVASAGRIAGGAARCSLVVPAGARGAVAGSLTVRSGGKSVVTRFSFTIR
jgi:hypothetical protein